MENIAFQRQKLGVGKKRNVGMSAYLHELRRKDAHCAVVGGESLVELGHSASDARLALDQENLGPGLGKVERGLDARDAAADDNRPFQQGDTPILAAVRACLRRVAATIFAIIS